MRGKLEQISLLAQTEAGREWLLKALHPTEPSIAAVGLPDGTASDTVCIELTMTTTLNESTLGGAFASPWGGKILLTPHMYPGAFIGTEGAIAVAPRPFKYPLFTGSTAAGDYSKLLTIAEAWRLCGQSVTIHLDANSTKDSGTIVAAQMVTKPLVLFPGSSSTGHMQRPLVAFAEGALYHQDNPSYDELMALPRAYQSNVRTGLYMPLKLSNTSQHWCSMRESIISTALDSLTSASEGWQLSAAMPGAFPFPFYADNGPYRVAANNDIHGYPTAPYMGDNWGHIAVSGLDPGSGLVVKFRSLLELKVQASSSYAPHMRPAPFPDVRAIENYFTIVRELPDAYPADHNDAGRILGVIGKAIKMVSPFLNVVPGVGPTLSQMAPQVSKILVETGKSATEARKKFNAAGGGTKKQRRRAVARAVGSTMVMRMVPAGPAPRPPVIPVPSYPPPPVPRK